MVYSIELTMANEYRGEVSLWIGDELYVMRYSWAALAELKSAFGDEYEQRIIRAGIERDVEVLAEAMAIAMREYNPDITKADVMEMSPPFAKSFDSIMQCLTMAYHGVKELPEEPEPRPKNRKAKNEKTFLSRLGGWLSGRA